LDVIVVSFVVVEHVEWSAEANFTGRRQVSALKFIAIGVTEHLNCIH